MKKQNIRIHIEVREKLGIIANVIYNESKSVFLTNVLSLNTIYGLFKKFKNDNNRNKS